MNDETRSAADEIPQGQEPLGWWESLNTTPLRDLLRGKWSCRLGYRRVLRESLLPAPIIAVIENIIRRARLWRRERFDVARELINHFREGLDRGATAALLVDQFGSAPSASRLIRRAKLRQRPRWWKTWYVVSRCTLVILAFLLIVYVVQAVRFFTGKPVITHNYLKEMNDAIRKIPMEDRGWPLYAEAMKDFPDWPKGIWEAADSGPNSEKWPILVQFVKENRRRVSEILMASKKPKLGWLLDVDEKNDPENQSSVELIDVSLAKITTNVQNAWRLLHLAIDVDLIEGRSVDTFDNFVGSLRIADQLLNDAEYPVLINQLIAISLFNATSQKLRRALFEHPDFFKSDELRSLADAWSSFNSGRLIRLSYKSERMLQLDFLQRIYTPGPNGRLCNDGRRYLHEINTRHIKDPNISIVERIDWWGPVVMTYTVGRQQALDEIDTLTQELIELHKVRPWEWTDDQNQRLLVAEDEYRNTLRNPLSLLVAAVSRLAMNAELAELNRSATLVALAITSFKREHGHWPETLDQLVPIYLPSIPLDPSDGQPLRYKLTAEGPLVYSVGPDRYDDAGKPAEFQLKSGSLSLDMFFVPPARATKIRNNPRDEYHGDWILWPPVVKKEVAKPAATKVQ